MTRTKDRDSLGYWLSCLAFAVVVGAAYSVQEIGALKRRVRELESRAAWFGAAPMQTPCVVKEER